MIAADDEALKDALSSPLEYVGAAVWPGRYKIPSCVYRNDKVLVVNSYCIRKEQHSISIAVLHPERGSAGFYAEGRNDDRITQLTRDDYTQWKFGASDPFPGLSLTMSMEDLLNYEGRRGKFAKGGCVAGMVLGNDRNASCGLKSPDVEQWWEGYYRPILKQPPPEWFTLVKELQRRVKKDRKKELLKTAAGKFVAPAPIENKLKTSPYITNAIVVGDTRKFVSVLIVPNFANIEAAARKARHDFATPTQMTGDPWVRDLLSNEIERLTAPLAQYEKPKRFALLGQDFTYAGGELTYTMKMKRRVIEQRYQDVIARLYADVEEPRPHHLA